MDVAGLVLGAVPIVLEALKQYRSLYRLCKRFGKCQSGVKELLVCLKLQNVIFENESRLLLADALGTDRAKAMINDLQNPLWQDPKIIERVGVHLGKSGEAMIRSGQDVRTRMRCLEEELQKLYVHDAVTLQMHDKQWRREVRQRFRFAFNESRLSEITNSIIQATKEYRVLRSQLHELATYKPEPENDAHDGESIERVTATQTAARHIYELLAAACTLHAKHHAQFSLQPQYDSGGNGTGVKFQIAYRHLSRQQARGSHDVLWFVVESIVTGTLSTIPPALSASDTTQLKKRAHSPTPAASRGTVESMTKRVRFLSPPSVQRVPVSSSSSQHPLTSLDDSSGITFCPTFGGNTDLCTHLRACCQHKHLSSSCIGWLKEYRVYQSKGPKEQIAKCAPTTLSKWLAQARGRQSIGRGLPLLQRLNLAKLLTTAVLNFHSTPWMQSAWKSDDIFLYSVATSNSKSTDKDIDAFVEVPVDQQTTQSATTNQSPFDSLAPYVRNSTLFSLAVILIELAFEAPLSEMVQATDCKPGDPRALAEVNAATRLCTEVSACLGPRYAKIVEQCLFCAFGQGTDLQNPALQGAIQKDVVSELDRLALGFQNLIL